MDVFSLEGIISIELLFESVDFLLHLVYFVLAQGYLVRESCCTWAFLIHVCEVGHS